MKSPFTSLRSVLWLKAQPFLPGGVWVEFTWAAHWSNEGKMITLCQVEKIQLREYFAHGVLFFIFLIVHTPLVNRWLWSPNRCFLSFRKRSFFLPKLLFLLLELLFLWMLGKTSCMTADMHLNSYCADWKLQRPRGAVQPSSTAASTWHFDGCEEWNNQTLNRHFCWLFLSSGVEWVSHSSSHTNF